MLHLYLPSLLFFYFVIKVCYNEACIIFQAKIAGRISVAQFKLATRLGDPDTQSRCRLYLALSLTQQGHLRAAKQIIRREFKLVKSAPEEIRDERLVKMCLGMWAKLKYTHYLSKLPREEVNRKI